VLYALEPSTDYLLDVERVPIGSAPSATGVRVLRIGFTTSRFKSLGELARLTLEAAVEHRFVRTRGPIDTLQARPAGAALDKAFSDAGLGVPEVPRYPRVEVLWSADAIPQPVAVVVESNEPLWRSRPMPTIVPGPPDATDPNHHWWAARPADWLALEPLTTPPQSGDPSRAPIVRVVRGPGDTRAVVLLGGGARGGEVRLALRRKADPLVGGADEVADTVRVLLRAAPWEEGG
jgi:large repetitive protein